MNILNDRIAEFYNRTTDVWMNIWGEHMHQGYYADGDGLKKDHRQAQVDLIEEMLKWAEVKNPQHILDAGCGVGGSARYLVKKFNATVTGYTLSSVQAEKARVLNRSAEISDKIKIVWDDVMNLTREKFDMIWSLESAEHIADKEKLIKMFHKHLKPGGKLVIATWCRRHEPNQLTAPEVKILNKIYLNYQLPPLISIEDLEKTVTDSGFINVQSEDWSRNVKPFWDAVMKSSLKWKSLIGLLKAGKPAIRGAMTVRQMKRGYKAGLIKFGVIKAEKE